MELPLFANGLEVQQHLHRLLYYVLDKSREYATTWTFKIPLVPRFVVVLDRESTFHILKSHFKNYEKGPMFHENLKDLLGDGIFNSDGHRWYVQRKTASHLFSSRMLETVMLPVFEKHTDTVCEQLAAAAKAGSEIDMQDTFFRFTLDSSERFVAGTYPGRFGSAPRGGLSSVHHQLPAHAFPLLAPRSWRNWLWRSHREPRGPREPVCQGVRWRPVHRREALLHAAVAADGASDGSRGVLQALD